MDDYPEIFVQTDIRYDIDMTNIVKEWGNWPNDDWVWGVNVHIMNENEKIILVYDPRYSQLEINDTRIDSSHVDGYVFHYNSEKHKEIFGEKIVIKCFGFSIIGGQVEQDVNVYFDNVLKSDDKIYYTVEYLNEDEKPGLITSNSINPKELLLRGEMMIDIIYDKTNIKTPFMIKFLI